MRKMATFVAFWQKRLIIKLKRGNDYAHGNHGY
jgi:hypothetical protein